MSSIHPLPLILASESKSRKQLLESTGLEFRCLPSNIDESQITGDIPTIRAVDLAKAKVFASLTSLRNDPEFIEGLILAADSVAVLNNKVMEKPRFKRHAVDMLLALSERIHTIVTGWTIYNSYKDTWHTGTSETYVTFRKLEYHEIVGYVNNNPVTTWAGGYNSSLSTAINFISKVEGSLTGLNGLPLDQICPILHDEWAHPYKKRLSLKKGEYDKL